MRSTKQSPVPQSISSHQDHIHIDASDGQSANQPTSPSAHQPIIRQPANQPISQSISQSTNQPCLLLHSHTHSSTPTLTTSLCPHLGICDSLVVRRLLVEGTDVSLPLGVPLLLQQRLADQGMLRCERNTLETLLIGIRVGRVSIEVQKS